ncbi:BnaC07g50580D [Brassica napus]|uniref:(rape) hypothetical protein n=1 Tax=Brassica napus TaxID=3708 RepID=A0A078J6N5_BRANA|nr:unnamed protein product [Brassica napus]CDY58715.1 BnaC07g50580D [Brassica napus]
MDFDEELNLFVSPKVRLWILLLEKLLPRRPQDLSRR